MQDVLDTTLCDKVCQGLAAGLWFSPGTPVTSTNKNDYHSITEILLKVAFKTITSLTHIQTYYRYQIVPEFVPTTNMSHPFQRG